MSTETLNLNNNSSFALVQPFKAETDTNNTETLEIKPLTTTTSETLEVKPLTTTTSETLEVKPLTTTTNETLEVKPLTTTTNETVELKPVRSDSKSILDLKPVALDVCMRTGPASLPPTHICQPYRHRIGLTMLGVELLGLAWSGDQQTIVDDRPRRPMVTSGDVVPSAAWSKPELPERRRGTGGHHRRRAEYGGGLNIRLDG